MEPIPFINKELSDPTFQYLQRLDSPTLKSMHEFLLESMQTFTQVSSFCLSIFPHEKVETMIFKSVLPFHELKPVHLEYPHVDKDLAKHLANEYFIGCSFTYFCNNESYNIVDLAIKCYTIFQVLVQGIDSEEVSFVPQKLVLKTLNLFDEFQKKSLQKELRKFEKYILRPISNSQTLDQACKTFEIVWECFHEQSEMLHVHKILENKSSSTIVWFIQSVLQPALHSEYLLKQCIHRISEDAEIPIPFFFPSTLSGLKSMLNNIAHEAKDILPTPALLNMAVSLYRKIKNHPINDQREVSDDLIELKQSYSEIFQIIPPDPKNQRYLEEHIIIPLFTEKWRMQKALKQLIHSVSMKRTLANKEIELFATCHHLSLFDCKQAYINFNKDCLYTEDASNHLKEILKILTGEIVMKRQSRKRPKQVDTSPVKFKRQTTNKVHLKREEVGRTLIYEGWIFHKKEESIRKALDISSRTFNKYFPSKEFPWPKRSVEKRPDQIKEIRRSMKYFNIQGEKTPVAVYNDLIHKGKLSSHS
ncbi:MAG: hypothetical protein K940chlam3_00901 [Chlamydiae bacterium]|nr:hypothetical protein [Chlamydiota bacterium]